MAKLTLKWGTLKSWDFDGCEKGIALLTEYNQLGSSASAMAQHDNQRQKEIICELIDLCDDSTIRCGLFSEYLSKEDAKKYVMEYRAD